MEDKKMIDWSEYKDANGNNVCEGDHSVSTFEKEGFPKK